MVFVIFDIDGTLADTKEVDDKCFIKAFYEAFQIDIQNEAWEKLKNVTDWGITEEILQRERNTSPSEMDYEMMLNELLVNLNEEKKRDQNQFKEVPGAKAFFDHLVSQPNTFKIGIATGAWQGSAQVKLQSIGIDWQTVAFSNSSFYKTREAILQDAIDQLTVKNDNKTCPVIYFGDGEWDYTTCQNLGISFIGIDIRQNHKLEKLGADPVFKDFSNTKAILQAMNSVINNN